MLSDDMAVCIARTASKSCGRAGLTSTVLPSVSSAYVAATGVLIGPPLRLTVRQRQGTANARRSSCSPIRVPGASRAGRAPFPPRECPPLPPRPPSASDWIVRSSLSKLAFAELDAEPAPRVVPLQGAGGGDR